MSCGKTEVFRYSEYPQQCLLAAFSLFYEEHRLFMLFGNHDIAKKDFHPFSGCCFHEGLRLKDCVTGQELYLTHGHQADFFLIPRSGGSPVFWCVISGNR